MVLAGLFMGKSRPAPSGRDPGRLSGSFSMSERKLLLINKFYHDKGPAGGVGRYLVQEEEDLVNAGWDVVPFAMADTEARPSPWSRFFVRARDYSTPRFTGGALGDALSLGEPEGYIRTFADRGPPMARLLYKAATRGIAPDYARRLLATFPIAEPEQTDPSKTQASKPELVEPLSERELEVLQLIAEGLTNQEIASRLFLSLNTVKVHTRNIYGKLGAHSRTQAVARARALGVLPST